jgi:endoglucanase
VDADTGKEMGGGPVIAIGPNFHTALVDKIKETARRNEVKFQEESLPGASGTDAWAIQVAREGVPTALFSIALRNMHSPVETLDLKDITRTGRLMAQFIAGLDGDFLAAIDWADLKNAEPAV